MVPIRFRVHLPLRPERSAARHTGRSFAFIIIAGLLLTVAAGPDIAAAQGDPLKEIPHVTRTIAIENARIVQAPDRILERGTVVMHAGVITDVGADIAIPYDAEIIRGDSLVVYAGFIDGLSHAGVPEAETPERPDGVDPSDPPQDVAGIQPDRRVRDLLNPDDASISALREIGFTAGHVVPRGRMLPGSGSIILLDGEDRSEMVLIPDVSQYMSFAGAPGVYPATPIGVMAKLRQLLRESQRRHRVALIYAADPAGLERPTYDPIHQSLYPIAAGEQRLFILADGEDSALEVHRALALAEELGFSAALAGLAQGFEVTEKLADADVPVFVTLGLPEEIDAEDDTTAAADTVKAITPEDPATFFISDLRTQSYEDVEAESENLEARRAMVRREYVANAAALHEAGIRFGFSTLGAEAKDIRSNLREMIDVGLPEEAALAALTIDAARLLGLERTLGTVESGKLANLVVTDGPYFEEESTVRFVFVEGRKFEEEEEEEEEEEAEEEEEEEREERDEAAALDEVAGTWNLSIDAPDGPVEAVIEFAISGGEVQGRVTSSELMRPADVVDATFVEGRLTFVINTSEYGRVEADVTVSGGALTGTIDVPGTGVLPISGTRVP